MKVISRKGYKKYQTIIQEKERRKILEKKEPQESYNTLLLSLHQNGFK